MKAAVCVLLKSKPTPARCVGGVRLNSRIRSALGRRLHPLLLLGAVCWSIHALVTSNAFAQEPSLPSTTSVIQSALNSDDVSAPRAWWSRAHQPSNDGTIRESAIAPLSNHRADDVTPHDGNQVAARQVTRTSEMRVDNSSQEYNSANLSAANSPDKICPKDSGGSQTKSHAGSPEYSLLSVCDWLRVIPSSGAAIDRRRNKDSLLVSDEPWLADGTSTVSKRTAPPIPLLVIHLGSYDLPVALRDSGW